MHLLSSGCLFFGFGAVTLININRNLIRACRLQSLRISFIDRRHGISKYNEVRLTNGVPTVKLWMLHRDQWEILDTWDVAGLRGSGSHDVVTEGGLVPARFADVDLVTVPPLYENPVFRIPVPLRLAYNKARQAAITQELSEIVGGAAAIS